MILAVADLTPLARVLLTLVSVILVGRLLGRLLKPAGQPPVIGEILAGILLGPSFLGLWMPEWTRLLSLAVDAHPDDNVLGGVAAVSQVGIVLFMFQSGVELDLAAIRPRLGRIGIITASGMAVPFIAGAALSPWLAHTGAGERATALGFTLFVGLSLSVTAFPVLARILRDRGMTSTPIGQTALGVAALGDAVAWCLLAAVLGVANARMGGAIVTPIVAAVLVTATLVFLRPLLVRWSWRGGYGIRDFTLLSVGILLSALATEFCGIHALFGAFLFGAMVPHDSPLATFAEERLGYVVAVILLPAFFAVTGLQTQIGLLTTPDDWLKCGVIIAIAAAGKIGGVFVSARLTGSTSREASELGVLMNTRGLMELIVLNLGLELGLISRSLFAALVLMAVVTTMMTGPLLHLFGEYAVKNETG